MAPSGAQGPPAAHAPHVGPRGPRGSRRRHLEVLAGSALAARSFCRAGKRGRGLRATGEDPEALVKEAAKLRAKAAELEKEQER